MATIPTHAFVGLAVADLAGGGRAPRTLLLAGAAAAALPDADVLFMRFAGVAYGDAWGHRGLTHSLVFALLLGALLALAFFRRAAIPWWRAALALSLAVATQGLLDAMTDGGLGVAFFAPFSEERFFLPWTPIPVAPLGIRAFFSPRGADLLAWELLYLWAPLTLLLLAIHARRRATRAPS